VYANRPDVHAILHTHQVYASALALVDAPIPALFDEQVRYLGRSVEIIPYAPSGTGFLKNNVRAKIRSGANAYILQNHGVLVLGGDAERAVQNLALLEKCALAYLLALLSERKVSKIPLAVREIAFAKLKADEKKFAGMGS
jgi:ribulose-5-phosphate 4-epimerase/fuculose-1-phosphate aldolase